MWRDFVTPHYHPLDAPHGGQGDRDRPSLSGYCRPLNEKESCPPHCIPSISSSSSRGIEHRQPPSTQYQWRNSNQGPAPSPTVYPMRPHRLEISAPASNGGYPKVASRFEAIHQPYQSKANEDPTTVLSSPAGATFFCPSSAQTTH